MKRWFPGVLLIAIAASAPAQERVASPLELTFAGGIASGPGSGRDLSGSLGVAFGPRLLRVQSGGWATRLHKFGTPGGYSVGGRLGLESFIGPFMLAGGITSSFTDQEVYTKRVRYVYGGAGYRWAVQGRNRGRAPNLNEVRFSYFRETFSTYANHAQVFEGSYRYDRRVGSGPWCVHLGLKIGEMRFDDNPYPGAPKRRGMTSSLGIGIAYR